MKWLGIYILMIPFASIAEEKYVKCDFAEGVELNIVFHLDEPRKVVGHFVENDSTTVINSPITTSKVEGIDTLYWQMDMLYEGQKAGTSEKWSQFRGHYYYEKTIYVLDKFPNDPQESSFTMLPCHVT